MNLRLLTRAVAAAAVLLAATSCVSIPESSSVNAGRAPGAQDQRPLSRNVPDGPRPGAGRKEIATGYLNAMLAYPPAPDVVRQFMTQEAAADWSPEDGLVVYTDSNQPRLAEKADSVAFRARALGSLDHRGTWTTAASGERALAADFTMARVNGEWRLRNPLPGSYVDEDYFLSYYEPFSLYYFDPTQNILAPDPVHMLLGDSLATSLVKDLLLGPTRDIDGAVSSSVPSTATVDVSVSISPSGVAEIPLSDEILQLSAEDRRLFAAQLAWTLRPLPDIKTIVVTVNGSRVDMGVGYEFKISDFSGFDPAGLTANRQIYGLTGQGLVTVSDSGATTVSGPVPAASRDARSVAVEPYATQAAVVSQDGSTVTVGGLNTTDPATTTWYSGGEDVIRPSWDIHEVLWMADNRSGGAHLYVAGGPNTVHEVYAAGITGRPVHSIAVSRDGIRLAAVVGKTDHRRLVIAVIDRDAQDPSRVTLRPAKRVVSAGADPGTVTSATWISPTSIAALTADEAGQTEPTELSIDGALVTPFSGFLPIKPSTLVTGPNADTSPAIGDSSGSVYVQTPDAQWIQIGGTAKIRAPVYPG